MTLQVLPYVEIRQQVIVFSDDSTHVPLAAQPDQGKVKQTSRNQRRARNFNKTQFFEAVHNMTRGSSSVPVQTLIATVLLSLAALAGNYFELAISFSVAFIFGSVAALLALQLLGLLPGLIVAAAIPLSAMSALIAMKFPM